MKEKQTEKKPGRRRKLKLPPSTAIVTQSNELVLARYALPVGEMRLLMTVIAKIQPQDTKLTVYTVPIADFADFLGIDRNSAYREMQHISHSLLGRVVTIKKPSGGILQTHWLASADYEPGSGVVEIRLDEMMLPYLIGLQKNFTQYKLAMLLSFKSQYTMRLYMLLKQRRDHNPYTKEYAIELDELRKILGVSIPAIPRRDKFDKPQEAVELYPDYKNFKARVLETARKELNAKADLSFEYAEIRQSRRVVAIHFRIVLLKRPELLPKSSEAAVMPEVPEVDIFQPEPSPDPVTMLLALVPEQHREKKGVRVAITEALQQHGFEYVKRNILYSNANATKNYAGYLAGALAIDYGHDWELEQQQTVKDAQAAQKTVSLAELNELASEIRALQRNLSLLDSPELRQQVEKLKAEYARKREIYDEENSEEEEETA